VSAGGLARSRMWVTTRSRCTPRRGSETEQVAGDTEHRLALLVVQRDRPPSPMPSCCTGFGSTGQGRARIPGVQGTVPPLVTSRDADAPRHCRKDSLEVMPVSVRDQRALQVVSLAPTLRDQS